jgi:integrase
VATLPAGTHGDGAGLYLLVKEPGGPTAGRYWIHRYVAPDGRRRERGLGNAREVSLADARAAVDAGRALLARGVDPLEVGAHKSAESDAFGEVALRYIEGRADGWRNAKHAAQWRSTIATYCAPFLAKRVGLVSIDDVDAALRPIWRDKPETARRLRARIAAVLDYAVTRGLRPAGENPARVIHKALPSQGARTKEHRAAIAFAAAPDLWQRLTACTDPVARAVAFQLLTAARPGEVRRATWSEIRTAPETGARLCWIVPADRMKAGREHRVPLAPAAVAILDAIAEPENREPEAIIFRTAWDRPLHENSARNLLMGLAPETSAHGLRSTFRDWCEEHDLGGRAAEFALAHVVKDATERAYQRSDLLAKRAGLMDRWSDYCTTAAGGTGDPDGEPAP